MYQGRLEQFRSVDIYPVLSGPDLSLGRSWEEVLDGVLAGGARIVQIRGKELTRRELFDVAMMARRRTEESRALLIINDHLDIAMAVDADGVHLGQDDLPIEAARRIAPDLILGASSHTLEEAFEAQRQGASYVNIGPIFPTKTKGGLPKFLGPEAITKIAPQLSVPFTTMGGITLENVQQVLDAGAQRIAVVTAITAQQDIARAVKEFRKAIAAAH